MRMTANLMGRPLGFAAALVIAHLAAAPVQLWVSTQLYPVSDMARFHAAGGVLAETFRADPVSAPAQVLALLTGAPSAMELGLTGGHGSDAMAVLAWAVRAFSGDSLLSACLFFALLAGLGRALLATALVRAGASPVAWWAMLVPSGIYWSSGLCKEAVVTAALGLGAYGVQASVERNWGAALPCVLFAALTLALIKPYLVFPAAAAAAIWAADVRGRRALAVGAAGVLLAAVCAELTLDRYAPSQLLEQLQIRQELAGHRPAASNVSLGPAADTWLGQLRLVPAALLTGLFRPWPWEAHNLPALLAGLENLALILLVTGGLYQRRRPAPEPVVLAVVAFVGITALGVGLTTINLGTLSRYRAVALPLLWFLTLGANFGSEPRESP